MTLERMQPRGLAEARTYSHVMIARATRLVFVAGQVAEDASGEVVGGTDLGLQARRACSNLREALASAGATPQDVARIGIYVVGLDESQLPTLEAARVSIFGDHRPTDVLVGVESLAHAGCLVEVDALAVTDG